MGKRDMTRFYSTSSNASLCWLVIALHTVLLLRQKLYLFIELVSLLQTKWYLRAQPNIEVLLVICTEHFRAHALAHQEEKKRILDVCPHDMYLQNAL
jgi:hypothetical protein